ncbi:hypothetical protein BDQ12DRAFT_389843 [Crucibulum laeve]|uniref:protein-histidine N-methyltransferase n=1 Tax=Crucibulum laeve TaxID=68775 RepID=A0A5C3M868_9AGAR|nr:hypothetical protein BDQ12DRAFT_389843 [Crucibulum laeve]
MFKFEFSLSDDEGDAEEVLGPQASEFTQTAAKSQPTEVKAEVQFTEHPISDLLSALPSLISYSPITIPLRGNGSSSNGNPATTTEEPKLTLVRRDLFDARFQLISEGAGEAYMADDAEEILDEEHAKKQEEAAKQAEEQKERTTQSHISALEFLEAPSDLVPGIYEGGLKTWECSLDLVDYLSSLKTPGAVNVYQGKRVLELGCGTAIPSLYVLHEILSAPPSPDAPPTYVHLQDYNASVLDLVTLPNVLLTWYISPASLEYRTKNPPEVEVPAQAPSTSDTIEEEDEDGDDEAEEEEQPKSMGPGSTPIPDLTAPSDLTLPQSLKLAFISSLEARNIHIRFFSGSWSSFDLSQTGGTYDLVLTSETIYRPDSLPSLVGLMDAACRRETGQRANPAGLDTLVQEKLSVDDTPEADSYLCLVAAKVLYFGVGGGVSDFVNAVENARKDEPHGKVSTVWERKMGVGRKVMRVQWD